MILADKLTDLRKRSGWSQEELAERLGVSRQSISKWESAQSVPDMNRILALSDLFGVTTDYLLRDEIDPPEMPPALPDAEEPVPTRKVSMAEANDFLAARDASAGRIALGVMLCILSPIPLILLSGAAAVGRVAITEERAVGLGCVPLLLLVAAAVALFITTSLRMNRFEYLEKEFIDTEYGVAGMVRERWDRFRPAYVRGLTLGIVLCVLAVLPLFIAVGLWETDWAGVISVAVLLLLVAFGVMLIIRSSVINSGFHMLLEDGEYTRENKLETSRNAGITAVYWGGILAVYLLWSFISGRWDRTWIIWAVSGVLYGVLCAVLRVLRKQP